MYLTLELGLRYFWVDALCIVQDDHATKLKLLQAMASIYAKSYLTIVCADVSDANCGLRGSRSSRPRKSPWPVIGFPSKPLMLHMEEAEIGDLSVWNTRGWTFQERAFASRMLVFNGMVSWICRSSHWCKDTIFPDEHSTGTHEQKNSTLERFSSGGISHIS
jgi:hypothetical protein